MSYLVVHCNSKKCSDIQGATGRKSNWVLALCAFGISVSLYSIHNKGSLIEIHAAGIWALSVRGGGLQPLPEWLEHFFREEFAKIKGAFAWF